MKSKKYFSLILKSMFQTAISGIRGGLGIRIRYFYYRNKFKSCGCNLRIGVGVIIDGADYISIGSDVWIDDYCILIAGVPEQGPDSEVKSVINRDFNGKPGEITIGNNIHFAPFCIIHGFGGVQIHDYVGLSSGVKVYSMSNHYKSFRDKGVVTYSNPMVKDFPVVYVKCPIVIEKNVFISLNSIVLKGTVGENTFVSPMSIVTKNIPENSYAAGNPAVRIRGRYE